MKVPCKNIPTYDYDLKEWSTTSFDDQLEFGKYLELNCYKEPGEYKFDERVKKWSEISSNFTKNGRYTDYAKGTPEYNDFWDQEELKSRLGVIWKSKDIIWYTTRDYYFLINFCPIVNKEKGYIETFCDIRDVQYHMMMYEKIAEIFHQHAAILKRRQMLFSFCHVAKTVNYLYFENRKRLKWFASDESFIDDVNGSWSILNQYKTHLNNHTDWYRNFSPDKGGEIQQRQQIKKFGKWEWEGNESSVVAKTLKKDPKLGVGGPTFWAWYEEGGIAPTADITLQYMEPALSSGLGRVGSFCIGGSVGDLKECKPLETFIKEPRTYGFHAVSTRWFDETSVENKCGLFIPAQYGMPEATDEYGNSDVELAIKLLDKAEFDGFKAGEYGKIMDEPAWKDLPQEQYVLKKSQSPRTIKEAFAWREMSFFNPKIIENTISKLEVTKPKLINCELFEDNTGEIKWRNVEERAAITVFPFKGIADTDKRGCVQIYELPKLNKGEVEPQAKMYFAGVDPIQTDITTTSNSLFCIYIFKNISRTTYIDPETNTQKVKVEGYKPVAWYIGRYSDRKQTNTQAEYLIRLYNAFTLVESNVTSFIDHMRTKNIENRYLMTKREASRIYGEDIVNESYETGVGYGIAMTMNGKLKNHILNKEKEYAEEILDTISKPDGGIVRTIYGSERIPDIGLLREFMGYRKGINTDRIVAFGLALSACELYATSGVVSDVDETDLEPDVIKVPMNSQQFFSNQKVGGIKRKGFFSSRMKV